MEMKLTKKELEQLDKEKISYDEKVLKEKMREAYFNLLEFLKEYLDLKEDYYSLIAIWILGTYLHKSFKTYPYLFANAMRGSGKTLLLEIVSSLGHKGSMLNSLTEAVLFRSEGTLCIDEFEGLMRKGKENLRELLNSAYKKGAKVKRLRKVHSKEGEIQKIEEFDVFRPIAMANIWGMEEVLGDRCISIMLEKSDNPLITKKQLNLDKNEVIPEELVYISVGNEGVKSRLKDLYLNWNAFIENKYNYKNNTYTIHNTHIHTQHTLLDLDYLFNNIDEIGIHGRNLELFFPLFIIAYFIDDIVFKEFLEITKKIIEERKIEEQTESKDVMVIDFVSNQMEEEHFVQIKTLKEKFREFIMLETEKKGDWLSSEWMGRALKRLGLIMQKRRVGRGVEVILNIEKAKKKILMFR